MNVFTRLKKSIFLPTVVDLGWSKTDALPMRRFQPNVVGWTWEDYYELMKKKYPVRYFFFKTFRRILSIHVVAPLRRFNSYVHDVLICKSHMLDLRQNSWLDGCDDYQGGYLDPRTEMLYACMNSLHRFIDETNAKNHLAWMESELEKISTDSGDEDKRLIFHDNIHLYREAIEIHRWWTCERKTQYLHLCKEQQKAGCKNDWKSIHSKWDEFEQQEDDMMVRLMKIRRGLWS